MGDFDLIATAVLLLVAGHETTVKFPSPTGCFSSCVTPTSWSSAEAFLSGRRGLIEELLRFDPPVHFRTRKALGGYRDRRRGRSRKARL